MVARQKWSKNVEFLLAAIGYCVGLGNVWRFPYLCYSSGGGAFLVPFFLMLILCAVPLLYMELTVGQYTQKGPVGALGKLCPLFKGAGLATVVISFLFTTYYNVIIAWAFYYLFSCFQAVLPWVGCNHDWNSPNCWDGTATQNFTNTTTNASYMVPVNKPNGTISPTEDFYQTYVLERTKGIEEPGQLKWELALILFLCWVLVYFCIWKGPKSTGKVVYFTATFPYLVLVTLLIRGVTLPGSLNGIMFFIKPKWELLLEPKVWVNAAAQNFNSIGIAFGGIITMSSYNKFHNRIIKDVIVIAVVDAITCLLAGFAIFSILGYLAENQGKSVDDVIQQGPGLVFVIYPEAFTTMPVPQLFAAVFFLMLISLGIDSQFASTEVIVTTINDHFHSQVKKYLRRKEVLVALVCFCSFICGLPNVTQGGYYFFSLIDHYAAAVSLMYLAFFEVIAITWFYGARRLGKNVKEMNGSSPNIFFIICWYFISPVFIFGIWLFSMISYRPFQLDDYEFPVWATVLGWFIAALSVLCVPIGMIHAIYQAKGNTLWQKFRNSIVSPLNENAEASYPSLQNGDILLQVKPEMKDYPNAY
ncbi:sodium- and chloride-dependent GABA transporter ine-like [Ostrea edulis]|uniref:sodium- and chloride-dependent GABA transporter ine-like n=1 Tax=Ostrea edulis TaxID=37623 RepID=UPI0020942560|nr:sodium- and chloride-dependent GABA transporter ine-like [Ostrea edulis]XP_048764062.1 sodium- and chloride-dependent GABA transporter ine-like [Ostrea edulis]XP_048764064.1 sodium- and chloride-dependent GABA transporter ine-like [Ostrea edulis]XP_048764072.1 sodium- and chloride-dependent GABA transporter ine-like [Ostrea edulis]XP_048764081.1 sodium- and chloride-dependent GABA transporter ine-like [Ostrea edulis]